MIEPEEPVSRYPSHQGVVVVCSHSIHDPLVSTLILDYMERVQRGCPEGDVLLFTEEPGGKTLSPEHVKALRALRIEWVPVHYDHREPFQWWRKIRNGATMLSRSRRFLRAHPGSVVLGFLGIAGAYALLIKELLGFRKGITFCFEPHSLYMRELGIWPAWGAKYRFTNWMERQQIKRMDVLVVPTTAGVAQAMAMGRKGPTPMLGITIDVEAARPDHGARDELRSTYGLGDDTVFIYVGKFGGIYHSVEQYVEFMCGIAALLPASRFVIVTHQEFVDELKEHPACADLGNRLVVLPPVPPEGLARLLSCADIGVVAIPPTPSQAYRTPVKTAHYWAAGLPILIPAGVSDDGDQALRHGTGFVVDDLPRAATPELLGAIAHFRALDPARSRANCVECAKRYRDTALSVALLNDILR